MSKKLIALPIAALYAASPFLASCPVMAQETTETTPETSSTLDKDEAISVLETEDAQVTYTESEDEVSKKVEGTQIQYNTYSYTVNLTLKEMIRGTVEDEDKEVAANRTYSLITNTKSVTGETTLTDAENAQATSVPQIDSVEVTTDASGNFSTAHDRTASWTVVASYCTNYDSLSTDDKAKADAMIQEGTLNGTNADEVKAQAQLVAFSLGVSSFPTATYTLKNEETRRIVTVEAGDNTVSFYNAPIDNEDYTPDTLPGGTDNQQGDNTNNGSSSTAKDAKTNTGVVVGTLGIAGLGGASLASSIISYIKSKKEE